MPQPNESSKDFEKTPEGWQERWTAEFGLAKKFVAKWHKTGEKVVKRYLDERGESEGNSRLNLFHSNVTTLRSMLYGRIPKVEVDRRHADANDDAARVASSIIQRMLNTDIEESGEDYSAVLRNALEDRLLPGLGTARIKYDFESQKQQVPPQLDPMGMEMAPGYEKEQITDEWVETIYTYWKDVLWSPCRHWSEMRWRAYRSYLNRDELIARFGAELGEEIPLNSKGPSTDDKKEMFPQAEVWEIWDKQNEKVFWFVDGFRIILDEKAPPLKLQGFFPEPMPLLANVTTTKHLPRPDYVLAQDLYEDIDELETRINMLTEACKVIGVYDKRNADVGQMLTKGRENTLIPVDNWAIFAEKGGLAGTVEWMPLDEIVNAIDKLTAKQSDKINQLYQVTGMADILRGAASQTGVSATEQSIKAKFASIRVQALQDEFARFASDLQRLKAEVICCYFQPESIIKYSNIMATPDAQLAPQAIQLMKGPDHGRWRITVKPETLAMVDYAQLKQDRTEFINALAVFLQSAAPIMEQAGEAAPVLMEMLKWGMAGFKGSNEIEGILDQAIDEMRKQPPGGNKKNELESAKQQMELQKIQMEMEQSQKDNEMKAQLAQQKHQFDMEKMKSEHDIAMAEIRLKMIEHYEKQKSEFIFQTEDNIDGKA